VRIVDEYVVRPWGLYLARPTPGRLVDETVERGGATTPPPGAEELLRFRDPGLQEHSWQTASESA